TPTNLCRTKVPKPSRRSTIIAIHDIDFHEPRFDRNTLRHHRFAKTKRPSLRRKNEIGSWPHFLRSSFIQPKSLRRAIASQNKPASDWALYGDAEYWASPLETPRRLRGLCESLGLACPLLAHSGHWCLHCKCPLLGVKRTSLFALQ